MPNIQNLWILEMNSVYIPIEKNYDMKYTLTSVTFKWQPNFFDRWVRNQKSLFLIKGIFGFTAVESVLAAAWGTYSETVWQMVLIQSTFHIAARITISNHSPTYSVNPTHGVLCWLFFVSAPIHLLGLRWNAISLGQFSLTTIIASYI